MSTTKVKWWIAIVTVAMLAGLEACAQDLTIKEMVRDGSGTRLPGMKATPLNESNSYCVSAMTGHDGSYTLASARTGANRVKAERESFQEAARIHIPVSPGSPVIVNSVLARVEEPQGAGERGSARAAETKTDSKTGKVPPVSGQQPEEGDVDSVQSFSDVKLYDSPQLKSGQFIDPAAAGGYSNTLANNSRELVKEYLQGQNSAVANGQRESDVYRKGSEYLAQAKYELAIRVLQGGIQQFPRSARLQIGLGLALYSSGRYREAIRALTAATDIAPSDPRAYLFLAKAYDSLNQPSDEVVRRMERFAQLCPRDPLASYYYAMSQWKVKRMQGSQVDLAQVESLLKRSVELDPAFPDARLQLGILYADQHKDSQAILEFQNAINLKGGLAQAHYHLAQAYKRIGEKARAEQELQVYERLRKRQDGEPQRR